MSNDSSSGGYLLPSASEPLPGGLTLEQFIQSVIVGVTGFAGNLVRPLWQLAPPKNPDIPVDWISFGVRIDKKDSYAYTSETAGDDDNPATYFQRQEQLTIPVRFYGPSAMSNASLLQDGLQIPQNLEALQLASMGYKDVTEIMHNPEMINERFFNRCDFDIILVRQVVRTYPILSFASASGSVHTVIAGQDVIDEFDVQPEETP